VDQATGYRYYGEHQEPRGVLLRRLRAAGLPLAEVTTVLDGSPEDTRTLLREHLHRMREQADAARGAVEELLRSLPVPEVEAVLGGPELASAVRQVVPAAAEREDYPMLGCVLIEFADAEVRLVATDRYRLAMRVLRPGSLRGDPAQLLVPARELARLGGWAARAAEVCLGTAPTIAFDPAVLGPAVDVGVGPDVLLEVAGPAEPVVVRSADQGSFTTLVMPMKLAPQRALKCVCKYHQARSFPPLTATKPAGLGTVDGHFDLAW
jgi:DNA-binding transcriptional MerR regulator